MYKLLSFLFISFIMNQVGFTQNNNSSKTAPVELSKESKKRIKTELKAYLSDPQKYLADQEEKKNKIKAAEKELEDIKTGLRIEKRDMEYARDSINLMIAQIEELKKYQAPPVDTTPKVEESKTTASGDCMKMPETGVFYKVQLGNFSSYTPSGFNGLKTFSTELGPKASKRFLAGYFTSVEEANQFADDVRKLGIKGAFVGQYKDGQRNESFDPTKSTGHKAAASTEAPKKAVKNTETSNKDKVVVPKTTSPKTGFIKAK